MRSTSIHSLNADEGLPKVKKVAYLLLNWVNNLFPYFSIDKRIQILKFNPSNINSEWEKTYKESSASRKLSDIFWGTLPWQKLKEELVEISVFDTGCGHGNYGVRMLEASEGAIKSYTGVDAKRRDNWKELERKFPNFKFIESRSTNISSLITKGTTLFISQSAIEHFDQDLSFFEQIRSYIESVDKPVMQIHLFPASRTLPLYLFHGFRQYTPRTISKITRMFGNNSEFSLTGLGGKKSAKVHFKYFTWPVLISRRQQKPSFDVVTYDQELKAAILEDIKNPGKSPLFWALIIKSNIR